MGRTATRSASLVPPTAGSNRQPTASESNTPPDGLAHQRKQLPTQIGLRGQLRVRPLPCGGVAVATECSAGRMRRCGRRGRVRGVRCLGTSPAPCGSVERALGARNKHVITSVGSLLLASPSCRHRKKTGCWDACPWPARGAPLAGGAAALLPHCCCYNLTGQMGSHSIPTATAACAAGHAVHRSRWQVIMGGRSGTHRRLP